MVFEIAPDYWTLQASGIDHRWMIVGPDRVIGHIFNKANGQATSAVPNMIRAMLGMNQGTKDDLSDYCVCYVPNGHTHSPSCKAMRAALFKALGVVES